METLAEYAWIVPVLMLSWICYRLWKRGKYRDPGQEKTYYNELRKKFVKDVLKDISGNERHGIISGRKRNIYECPYDIEARSCKDMNCPEGYIDCKNCDWYNNGVRPSKF